jgi:hypothetical protein
MSALAIAGLVLVMNSYLESAIGPQNSSTAGKAGQAGRFQIRMNSFLLSNFRNHDTGSLLQELHSFGFRSRRGHGGSGPFFFSQDGAALLPRRALQSITELPPGMVWIGDETIPVMMISGHYAKVVTSRGILEGGWSKNCYFVSALLRTGVKCGVRDLLRGAAFGLPFIVEAVGEAHLPAWLETNRIDAIIAGPRTYRETKQLLLSSLSVQNCLGPQIDIDSVLVLINKRCLREPERPVGQQASSIVGGVNAH